MSILNKTGNGDLQTALNNAANLLAHDPHLAEDAAQEAFVKAWTRLAGFAPEDTDRGAGA